MEHMPVIAGHDLDLIPHHQVLPACTGRLSICRESDIPRCETGVIGKILLPGLGRSNVVSHEAYMEAEQPAYCHM